MKPLQLGFHDSLNIMAFKWRGLRPVSQKLWLLVIFVFAFLLIIGTAFMGAGFRLVMTSPVSDDNGMQENLILWMNIFLSDNASLAAGGVLWALIASITLIPLVGYSFASIIPEGDLASIKVTDNHKISDSIFLQFVSTISFVQLMVLTALTSIFTIGAEAPGLGIFFSWSLWVVAVLMTVLAAWSFEFLYRKFGLKSKLLIFAGIGVLLASLYLLYPDTFMGFFGIGEKYALYVQSMSFNNLTPVLVGLGVLGVLTVGLLYLISLVASKTLQRSERTKKRDGTKVLIARLGLQNKNKVNNLTQFLANMILRQNNIWKPLALSSFFSVGMAVAFYSFYEVMLTVAALIPIMVSLVWSVNIFGIIGSGTTWLVSLPQGKKVLLNSVVKIQYFVIGLITLVTSALVFLVYRPEIYSIVEFILSTVIATAVITQFALHKAVYSPFRYRVHIRGESVLPPNKAFSYMIQLFIVGFLFTGLSFGVNNIVTTLTGGNESLGILALLGFTLIVCLFVYQRFVTLRRYWLTSPEIVQNIIKTVGQH